MPFPKPTEIGVLNSIAEIGAAPVTVRKRTPQIPIALPCRRWTSSRAVTSYIDARSAPVRSIEPGTSPGRDTSAMPLLLSRRTLPSAGEGRLCDPHAGESTRARRLWCAATTEEEEAGMATVEEVLADWRERGIRYVRFELPD